MKRLIDFSSRFRILKGGKVSLVVSAFLGGAVIASAAPSGGEVTSGTASISQSGTVTNIDQSTSKASINWTDFSIAANETVNFNQPNSSSITLNRVVGNEKSVIDGALNANGQVWILNSNGILFNSTAKVNTAGILATTAELSDTDFQNGNYEFKNSVINSVINLGTIEVANSGYVVLASNEVKNSGTIKAVKGKVHLVGADEYTLNLNGNSLVNLIVNKGVLDSMVENSGTIIADGGEVYLTTNAVNELLRGVVNNTGIIEANSLDGLMGKVEVFAHGGTASVSGTIEAKDGFVETSGEKLSIKDGTIIKAKDWLLDPTNITIASSGTEPISGTPTATTTTTGDVTISASTIQTALATTNVTLEATNDITVNEALTNDTVGNKVLTLRADSDNDNTGGINVNAVITVGGGDGITLNYGSNSNLTMKRDDATNSFTGKINLASTSVVNINGAAYTVINTLGAEGSTTGTDLQGINGSLAGNYVMGSDIANGSDTSTWNTNKGFAPISPFTGNFDGLGHTIDQIFIHTTGNAYGPTGLFGGISGTASISNIGLTNINYKHDTGGGAGGLVASSSSDTVTINNVFTTGTIQGLYGNDEQSDGIGGLIGNLRGNLTNSYSSVNITDTTGKKRIVGGLVGKISNTTNIEDSYATGNLSGYGYKIGGLIGHSDNISAGNMFVRRSYATGDVTNTGLYGNAGGFIGEAAWVEISDSYATGDVLSAGSTTGGFVATTNYTTIINKSYSTGTVTLNSPDNTKYWNSVGGFAGIASFNSGTTYGIFDSYSKSNITATNAYAIGGFIGYGGGYGKIDNSYYTGSITDSGGSVSSRIKGFMGYNHPTNPNTITNSFWDVDTSLIGSSGDNNYGATGKATGEMKAIATYNGATGWSITTDDSATWKITEGSSYPCLSSISGSCTTAVTYTLSNILSGYTYKGSDYLLTNLWSTASLFDGTDYDTWTLGTDYTFSHADLTGSTISEYQNAGFTNAGTYNNISINVLKSGYALASTGNTEGSFKIDKKDLTISGLTAANKVYDGKTNASITGLVLTGKVDGDSFSSIGMSASFNDKNIGIGKTVTTNISINGAKASNYNVIQQAPITANITPKELTISGLTSANKVYDGTTTASVGGAAVLQTFEAVGAGTTLDGKAYIGDTVSLTGTAVGNFNDKDVADATSVSFSGLSLTGDQAGNYLLANHSNATHTISKANATVTANSATKVYNGQTQSVNGFSASGLVNGETTSVLSNLTLSGSGTNAGTYTVTVSGTDENYNLTFINGKLIITKATQTPSIPENSNKVRDIITPISNTLVLNNFNPKPRVDVNKPSFKTPENNTVNVASQPMAGNGNKLVTMSELKNNQNNQENSGVNANADVVVPLGDDSIIQLVNAGVNLPVGVEQLFFVSTNENQEN